MEVLVLALRGAPEVYQSFCFSQIFHLVQWRIYKKRFNLWDQLRLSAIEEAQQNVVAVIRRLDENGEIYLGRGNQDAVVK